MEMMGEWGTGDVQEGGRERESSTHRACEMKVKSLILSLSNLHYLTLVWKLQAEDKGDRGSQMFLTTAYN